MRATKFRKIFIAAQRPIAPEQGVRIVEQIRSAVAAQDDRRLIDLISGLDIGYTRSGAEQLPAPVPSQR